MSPRPPGTADEDRLDVERVRQGNTEAFAILVDRHQGRIIAHLGRLVGRDDAEDLAQDTFVRAFQAIHRYDPRYPFRGWLLVIASRLAANHVAKRRERTYGDLMPHDPGPSSDNPAQVVLERDAVQVLERRLDQALAELSLESRTLYELRFRQGLDTAHLAHQLGLSANALTVRIHRLRAALMERLGLTAIPD